MSRRLRGTFLNHPVHLSYPFLINVTASVKASLAWQVNLKHCYWSRMLTQNPLLKMVIRNHLFMANFHLYRAKWVFLVCYIIFWGYVLLVPMTIDA